MALARSEYPKFRPQPPWWGGDLQTVRNMVTRTKVDLSTWPAKRLYFDLGDGDRLAGALHRQDHRHRKRPLVVLIHGLTGCEDSIHVRATAHHLLGAGYPVLRLNLRGSAGSRATSSGLYHAGESGDLAAVFGALGEDTVAIGYSLGGNMLLKYLGEAGERARLRAAVAVSVPIDLLSTSRNMQRPRNRIYHDYMLRRMKAEALAPGAEVSDREQQVIQSAESVFDFDDRFVASRQGFADAEDYYEKCKSLRFLGGIARPTLMLHARDDPWIPPDAYMETDWSRYAPLRLILTEQGGHCGFHGADSTVPWHDRCAVRFLDGLDG